MSQAVAAAGVIVLRCDGSISSDALQAAASIQIKVDEYMSCAKALDDRLRIRSSSARKDASTGALHEELRQKSDLIQRYAREVRSWEANFAALAQQTADVEAGIIPST